MDNNMESLLMSANSYSSSGESETEVPVDSCAVSGAQSAVAASVPHVRTTPADAQTEAPVPAAAPTLPMQDTATTPSHQQRRLQHPGQYRPVAAATAPPPTVADAGRQRNTVRSTKTNEAPTAATVSPTTNIGTASQQQHQVFQQQANFQAPAHEHHMPSASTPPSGSDRQSHQMTHYYYYCRHQEQQQTNYSSIPPQQGTATRSNLISKMPMQMASQQQHRQPVPSPQQQHWQTPLSQHLANQPPSRSPQSTIPVLQNSRPQTSLDPYEPVTIGQINELEQNRARQNQQAMMHSPPSILQKQQQSHAFSHGFVSPNQAPEGRRRPKKNRATTERDRRKKENKFLLFTRVLLRYVEKKDPPLHLKVKAIINDCAERNQRQERGFESVTSSVHRRLKEVVKTSHWERAKAYLNHFLAEKVKRRQSRNRMDPERQKNERGRKRESQLQQQRQGEQKRKRSEFQEQPQRFQQQQQQLTQQGQNSERVVATGNSKHPSTSNMFTVAPTGGEKQTAGKSAPRPRMSQQKSSTVPATNAAIKLSETNANANNTISYNSGGQATVREYKQLMEMVDQAVNYDWTAAGFMLAEKTQSYFSKEKYNLRCGGGISASSEPSDWRSQRRSFFPAPRWGRRNVISSRTAWARVRLPEQQQKLQEERSGNPVVGNGLLSLPFVADGATSEHMRAETASSDASPCNSLSWQNELVTEEDPTLALLSEGTQTYIKSILEKALFCAQQRENVYGLRLWHQQSIPSSKVPLFLRLGCDVAHQTAQAQGNAALICKRMEEALERQPGISTKSRLLNDETLNRAVSMSDLALRPRLSKGVESAEYEAKRSFEIKDGKECGEPLLGRIPKQAKLEVRDIQLGMNLATGVQLQQWQSQRRRLFFC